MSELFSDDSENKILHVTETIKGGIATYLNEIHDDLGVRYGPRNIFYLVPKQEADQLVVPHAQVIYFNKPKRNIFELIAYMNKVHKVVEDINPCIVHVHSTFAGFFLRVPFLFKKSKSRPKVIYCAHGWSFTMNISRWRVYVYSLIEKVLATVTDKIINISDREGKEAFCRGVGVDKSVVIKNAISPASPNSNKNIFFSNDTLNILFVGRLDKQKGFDLAVDIVSHIYGRKVALYVIGDTVLTENVVKSLPANVHLLGWKNTNDIVNYYSESDVLLMPSRWEGFGFVAIEAMRESLPVLASNVGALPEIVLNGVGGWVFDIKRPEDASRLLSLIDRKVLECMRDSAKSHFVREFSKKEFINKLFLVYDELLDCQV